MRLRESFHRRLAGRRRARVRDAACVVDAAGARVSMGLGAARGLAEVRGWELVVDLMRGTLTRGGVALPLSDQLREFVRVLVEERGEPVAVARLYEGAWRLRWVAPEQHAMAVQAAACRLRRLLAQLGQAERLVAYRGAYALRLGAVGMALRAADTGSGGVAAAAAIPELVAVSAAAAIAGALLERGVLENRDLRRRSGISRSALQRLLQRLVRSGVLVRIGRGRAVHYVRSDRPG